MNNVEPTLGFWGGTAIFIFSYVGSYIGALVGDFLRRIAHPNAFLTTGGMSEILKIKFFWAIGPQLIGMVIGSLVGMFLAVMIFELIPDI